MNETKQTNKQFEISNLVADNYRDTKKYLTIRDGGKSEIYTDLVVLKKGMDNLAFIDEISNSDNGLHFEHIHLNKSEFMKIGKAMGWL